jgi:predicted molibdopterin-dependent oxidoreductase YjgC
MDLRFVRTTCPYCGCGCEVLLETLDGKLIEAVPSKTNPMNQGKLCIKGWNTHEFVHSPNRLTKPLLRKNGELVEASWDEALDFTANRLKEIKETSGGNSVAFLTSAKCSNEENYLLQKFCRVGFGTNNIDHCARL